MVIKNVTSLLSAFTQSSLENCCIMLSAKNCDVQSSFIINFEYGSIVTSVKTYVVVHKRFKAFPDLHVYKASGYSVC